MCDIKPTICMTSYEYYVTSQPLFTTSQDCIHNITSTLADSKQLFVCHGTPSVYDIICIICYVTHTVCRTTKALYLTWNQLKLPSLPLYMSSHPLCWRQHTYCVRHHRQHMYATICIIHDIISTLYDNNPYYLWHHRHYIHYITRIIYDISLLCMMSHSLCVWCNEYSACDVINSKEFCQKIWMWCHV